MTDRKRKNISLAALCLGFFMVIMDVTVVNVALPNIASSLQTSVSSLQWVVAGYTLTFACFLLFSGNLADQAGAKKILILGLILFTITSLACGLAPTINLLILFRLLQGAAAATLVPSSLALINSSYDTGKERAKAIGIWGGLAGVAAACGPVLGGILTALFGWRAVFFINVPIAVIAIFLVIKYVIDAKLHTKARFDIPGQLLGIMMTVSLAFALIEVGRYGWLSIIVISAGVVFAISFILFLFFENRVQHPMFPLKFFKSKNFSIAIVIGMIINIGLYGELFILPLYFQNIRGFSVMKTGFSIFPLVMMIALASFLSGKLASYKGTKLPMTLGLIIGLLGFFSLSIIIINSPSYYSLVLPLAAMGFGVAFTMPAATITAMHSVPHNRAGMASGTFTTSRQIGSLLGVAVFGTIVASSSQFMHGMFLTLIISGLLFLFGFLLSCVVDIKIKRELDENA